MPISAPVWSFASGALQKFDPMDQNADGVSDENPLNFAFTGQTPGDVYAVPAPDYRRLGSTQRFSVLEAFSSLSLG